MEKLIITNEKDLFRIIKKAMNDVVDQLPKRRVKPWPKKELKDFLKVSYPTLMRWERKGLLERLDIEGKVFYTIESVEKILSNK